MLKIDGDYGHYPRGRVVYNVDTNEFYLYIDKELKNNQKIIDEIKILFNLISSNTKVKSDSHYTHDLL